LALRSGRFIAENITTHWKDAGWKSKPIWTLWKSDKFLAAAGNRFTIYRTCCPRRSHRTYQLLWCTFIVNTELILVTICGCRNDFNYLKILLPIRTEEY